MIYPLKKVNQVYSVKMQKGISISDFINKDPFLEIKVFMLTLSYGEQLDVLSFAPFQSTDAFGGIIVTEWYKKGKKQIKLVATIKSRELRSEGISLKVYIKNKNNEISEDMILARKIEDLILTKARRIRLENKLN